jgi:membrane protein DedA with SNARE-associated domain
MNDLLALIVHHGYTVIFLIVLAEALGIPVPAALALVTGGAAVASGVLRAPAAALVAVTALLVGDSLLYLLGRRMGWRLLGLLCRVSVDPETCIQRSAESFYKDLGYGSPARFKEEVQAVGRELCQALFLGRVGE